MLKNIFFSPTYTWVSACLSGVQKKAVIPGLWLRIPSCPRWLWGCPYLWEKRKVNSKVAIAVQPEQDSKEYSLQETVETTGFQYPRVNTMYFTHFHPLTEIYLWAVHLSSKLLILSVNWDLELSVYRQILHLLYFKFSFDAYSSFLKKFGKCHSFAQLFLTTESCYLLK